MTRPTRPQRVVNLALGEGYEFWRGDAKRTLKANAIALLAQGFSEEDAAQIIASIWSASAEEFGA
jgi:hypothetical protein